METKKHRPLLVAWLLVTPVLLLRGFTTIYPVCVTFWTSFFDIRLLRSPDPVFIGLKNYIQIFTDPKLIKSLQFTGIFTVTSMAFHVVIGICLALLLNVSFKGKKFLRSIVLIPWAMPMVVVGIAARWAFNNNYGLINDLIRRIIPSFHFDWLVYPASARAAVIMVDLWKDIPYFSILVLAALQFIPNEVYEAARIDGANKIQAFFRITLPSIIKTVLTLCIFFTTWRIISFDVVYTMTSGGPGNSTSLLAYRIMTEAFTNLNIGYASAIAVVLFLILIAISSINILFIRRMND
ncbi:carbohydrate ABC transporter permease [Breznakiella homolactica]|uniref:Sugar ABC transporter permease n=1 Tax=Breznakiella homolactica TaxID=2798577 RepID=A0A7T8BAY0_9SPIR|nr:sugar ABC transporter permease [Breznakiella homolactica]QQO09846.1 sugar ABC transporter permease [Breznakiella homolactica]